jgi:tRNA (cytidine/uridine-2'-O-)-methyltransferase
MFNIVLLEPEIPPNTGNIIRLCANTGAILHLIHPVAFELDDARMMRAGLDYHEFTKITQHDNFDSFISSVKPGRLFACSTKGSHTYSDLQYRMDDTFLFGPETRGLPIAILDSLSSDHIIRIPMLANSRSLNLSNAVAVVLYEAWRQNAFSIGG